MTGQLRCQQGHWAFHKVSKPEAFLSPKLRRRQLSRRNNCQVYGPRAAIAHHVCFNVVNGFGDRDVGKQMAKLYGWDTFKQRAFDRISECPSAGFITGAEFAHVKSIVETA